MVQMSVECLAHASGVGPEQTNTAAGLSEGTGVLSDLWSAWCLGSWDACVCHVPRHGGDHVCDGMSDKRRARTHGRKGQGRSGTLSVSGRQAPLSGSLPKENKLGLLGWGPRAWGLGQGRGLAGAGGHMIPPWAPLGLA